MKTNYTHISFVLDRSGSMETVKEQTVKSFNDFVTEQQKVKGDATFTLLQFDNEFDFVYNFQKLDSVAGLNQQTYVPRSTTALRDAIGKGITETGQRLSSLNENDRPEKVIFVILTDGLENASREYTMEKINQLISEHTDLWKWEFVFLGANQDAIASAKEYGIKGSNSMTYAHNDDGTRNAFTSFSCNVSNYRGGTTDNMSFSDEDRKKQNV